MTRRIVPGDGVELAVYVDGVETGPTVLMVHGYPDTHAVWDGVASRLAHDHRVITYDVRGAGASTRPKRREDYRFEHLMADMRAVLDAVAPDRTVHLVGHDWGSLQAWEAVTTMAERFASFTSISGPCLDHVAYWTRRNLGDPSGLPGAMRQSLHSWYIAAFQTPVLPELVWRHALARRWGPLLNRLEGVPSDHPAPTFPDDAAAGVNLYRANMRERLRHPRERRTSVPTQVIVPTKDRYVTAALAAEAPRPWVTDLVVRRVTAPHWLPVINPDVTARLIAEHIDATVTGHPSRALRKARARAGTDGRDFEAHLVVVTGAGSGIGRETAFAFAEAGAEVIAADIDGEAAQRTAELAGLLGPRSHAYTVDVSDANAMEDFAKTIKHDHGTPDIVVNNAGIGMAGSFLDHTTEDWRRLLGVNLWGVIHGCRLFAAQMAERGEGGHIVNTASAAAYTPSRMLPAYSTSKAAVLMLSECLRAELAGQGIGVSAICPGVVNTNITRTSQFVGLDAKDQEARRSLAARAYGRRNYGPEKVAAQILKAVRENRAVVPVTPEAHAGRILSRLSPAAMRRLARLNAPGTQKGTSA